MKFGFHVSIGGGFKKVPLRAYELKCETAQIFSTTPRGWVYKPIDKKDAEELKKGLKKYKIDPFVIHLPYLPNLASPDRTLYNKSKKALIEDLRRTEILGGKYLVIHPGAYMNSTLEDGIERIIRAINEAFRKVKNKVFLLLENTAGEGTEIGRTFAELKSIIDGIDEKKRVGIVLDTAHAFEGGYDVSTKRGLEETLEEIDKYIGLNKLYLLHLNDSYTPFNSRKDRHWHIGKGYIGEDGFKRIINHPVLSKLPAIMETPRKSPEDDKMNMKIVRRLAQK